MLNNLQNSPKDGTSAEPQHFTYDKQQSSANQATFEGQLNAKNTILDGKVMHHYFKDFKLGLVLIKMFLFD